MNARQITVALTGASGAAYGLRLIQALARRDVCVHLLISDAAKVVLAAECDVSLPRSVERIPDALCQHLNVQPRHPMRAYASKDWFAPVASGSAGIRQMVIAPCSMGTLARVAQGMSENLIERAADVVLKERGQLILMPRETPLSAVHLQHMLSLARLGVHIVPAMPGFYHRPKRIEDLQQFMVERVLDHLQMRQPDAFRWGMRE